ncbi:hypothetical protein PMIN06_007547 [Paraphaeosphaeria minitans]
MGKRRIGHRIVNEWLLGTVPTYLSERLGSGSSRGAHTSDHLTQRDALHILHQLQIVIKVRDECEHMKQCITPSAFRPHGLHAQIADPTTQPTSYCLMRRQTT